MCVSYLVGASQSLQAHIFPVDWAIIPHEVKSTNLLFSASKTESKSTVLNGTVYCTHFS